MGIQPVPFCNVKVNSSFWSPVIDTVTTVTVRACLDQCEKTGRLDNFRKAAGRMEGPFRGIYYDDSDVYKVLEGAAYCLLTHPDAELEQRVDEIIDDICAAQQPDGYINSYYTLTGPDQRWTDMGMHEDYCIGHLIEAAVAYHQATGKDRLLQCAIRAADHMMSLFGPGKRHWVVGHEEPELALVRLWRDTGETRFLTFSQWLLSERGHGYRKAESLDRQSFGDDYTQDDVPVTEARKVVGHAVRAMYLYSAMADHAGLSSPSPYDPALDALWQNVVPANLYLTGGIGQSSSNEGFTRDYHKPNLTAYCETCASIGMALWNQRMSLLRGDSKYADLVERELYNGILAGISLSGDHFFYENPLASAGNHHRRLWYGCSCCPTNLVRFLPSVGGACYAADEDSVYIHQFIGSEMIYEDENGKAALQVTTEFPWEGTVTVKVKQLTGRTHVRIRIPDWCDSYRLEGASEPSEERGYLVIPAKTGDLFNLKMEMPIRRVYEDPRVKEDAGRVALMRGPVVYCAEETDNPGIVTEYFHADLCLPKDAPLALGTKDARLRGAQRIEAGSLQLIPYYCWDNRESGGMTVWMKE